MKKCTFLLVLSLLITSFCSCSQNQSEIITQSPKVAYVAGTPAEKAFNQINSGSKYSGIKYNLIDDAVVALENGKVDHVIINDYDLSLFENAGRKLNVQHTCDYYIDYCMYFTKENEALREKFDYAVIELKNNGVLDEIKSEYIKNGFYENSVSNGESGTIIMLCAPRFENRIYFDENSNLSGIDYYMLKEICAYLDYELKLVVADYNELFIKLDKGEGDFVAGAIEYTPERDDAYLSGEPYYTKSYYLVTAE